MFSRHREKVRMVTPYKEQIVAELNKLNDANTFTLIFDGTLYSLWVSEKEAEKDAGKKQ